MKTNHILRAAAIGALCVTASSAMAQNESGYFTDNYTYSYQLNPALGNDRGFVSFPALGNFNLQTAGSLGVNKFIFNVPGVGTTTFMNPRVDTKEFMDGLKENNRLGFNTRIGILSFGFKAFHGYNTVSINAVADVNFRAPKSIFAFLKEGVTNRTYDITNFDAAATGYAEIAFNHSHQINNRLRIGATLKVLVGAANIDANLERAELTLGTDNWTAVTNARIRANVKGLRYDTDRNETTGHTYVSGVNMDDFSAPNGYGMAVDLGAVYTLNTDWQFSAALTDLGFISWKNNMEASTQGEHTFALNDYTFDPDDLDASWDEIKDEITQLYELDDLGDTGGRTRALASTMRLGARYTFPLYRKLNFGLLNTTRMAGRFSTTEFRLSANVQPVKLFSAGINYGVGTFGSSFGWIMNFSAPGFNLYVGMDHVLGKLAKQGVPLNSNAQLSLGINFLIR